jgi:hypothetical protein
MHVWRDDDVIKLADQNWPCAWPGCFAVGRTGWPRLASTKHETSRCSNELAW